MSLPQVAHRAISCASPAAERPFAFRVAPSRTIEAFADRDQAETRADQLGADGIEITWLRYPRADSPDDGGTLAEDPPRAADREWLAAHPAMEAADDYGDFMAWLNFFHDLPWLYYGGSGTWDQNSPCLPERKDGAR